MEMVMEVKYSNNESFGWKPKILGSKRFPVQEDGTKFKGHPRICRMSDYENFFKVVDINSLQPIFNDGTVDEEVDIFNMTSLGNIILGQSKLPGDPEHSQEDDVLMKRLSLAYERLSIIPNILLQEFSSSIRILDISHNEFSNLDFLTEFTELTSLICDHNRITSSTSIPYLPKLELLWMNHCKLTELYSWASNLQESCPNLKYLSLMGNQAAPSYLNGGNFYEYLHYRLFLISLFPNLVHLDDRTVTQDQRDEAKQIYHRPIINRIVSKTQKQVPRYMRRLLGKCSNMLRPNQSSSSLPVLREKNAII